MALRIINLAVSLTGLLFLAMGLLPIASVADDSCQIRVEIPDLFANPGEINFEIPIYLTNEIDTIGGFELWLILDRPDLMEFQTGFDTLCDTTYWLCTEGIWPENCTDSIDVTDSVLLDPTYDNYDNMVIVEYEAYVGNYNTAGTLTEDWEYISCASIGEQGHDLKIAGRANIAVPMEFAIPPQDGQTAVIRILADIYEVPDSLWGETVRIFIMADDISNFGMVDNWGVDISPTFPDTNYFCFNNGSVTILYPVCGDYNLNGRVDLLDIVGLINCLYMTPGSDCYSPSVDVNCDGSVDILDITGIIMNVYPPGMELNCCY